jgi:adenosine deaminase
VTAGGARPFVGLNLHTHLEGSVRPRTAAELAEQHGIAAPPGGWEAALRMREPGTLTTFLEHVATVYPLFSTPDAIARIVAEAVGDAAADGVAYLELRFGPATHATTAMTIREVVAAATAGLAEGTTTAGMPAGLVVCALRHHDDATNAAVARAAADHAGRGVVGFDVAGDELRFPSLEPMQRPFAIAAAAGLGLTAHAAEAGGAGHARDAVERLGVRRIGHGIRAADSDEVVRWAASEGVCFEECPTSNVLTGAVPSHAEHPIRTFLAAGCDVVIGDDDPTTTGSPLSSEFAHLVETVGLTAAEIDRIHATSLARAFCEESTRVTIRNRLASGRTQEATARER